MKNYLLILVPILTVLNMTNGSAIQTAFDQPWSKSLKEVGLFPKTEVLQFPKNVTNEAPKLPKNVTDRYFNPPTVAIIGGGINSALCAHYLQTLITNIDIQIDIYEPKSLVDTIPLHVHSRHRYINEITENMQLDLEYFYKKNARPIIFDGIKNYPLNWRFFVNMDKKFYGSLAKFVFTSFKNFSKIYELQQREETFATVQDLLSALGKEFIEYWNASTRNLANEFISKNEDVSSFLEAILLRDYLQNLDVNGFAGLSSFWFSEITGSLKQFANLYQEVVNTLIGRGKLLKREVVSIIRKNSFNYVLSKVEKQPSEEKPYDFVIIAEHITIDKIKFLGFKNDIVIREYGKRFSEHFAGELKRESCGIQNNQYKNIHHILNIRDQNVVDWKEPDIWVTMAFGNEPNLSTITEIFTIKDSVSFSSFVKMFPDYSTKQNASFVLGENLFDVKAIDWANISLELAAIGAKNVTLMIKRQLDNFNRS